MHLARSLGLGAILAPYRCRFKRRLEDELGISLLFMGNDTLLAVAHGGQSANFKPLAYSLRLGPLSPAQAAGYFEARLRAAGIHGEPFAAAAVELIVAAAAGLPWQLNHLTARSLENAVREQSAVIGVTHVQHALEQLPWLAPLPSERPS